MQETARHRLRSRPHSLLARFCDRLLDGVPAMNRHARDKVLARRLE